MFSIPGIVIGNSSRRDGMFTIPGSVIGNSSTGGGMFTIPGAHRGLEVFAARRSNMSD